MNTLEAIKKRKSVRVYKEESVEMDKIEAIVNAGNHAAQTNTSGPLHINVITNKEMLKNVAQVGTHIMKNSGNPFLEKAASAPNYNPIYNAPVMIVISAEGTEDKLTSEMNVANAACAAQNMLIAATELKLGSCYTVAPTLAFMSPELKAQVSIPENISPICVVLVGYEKDLNPNENTPKANVITYL